MAAATSAGVQRFGSETNHGKNNRNDHFEFDVQAWLVSVRSFLLRLFSSLVIESENDRETRCKGRGNMVTPCNTCTQQMYGSHLTSPRRSQNLHAWDGWNALGTSGVAK